MLTVACVLKSGGRYTQEWVAKLQRGVAKHLTLPHRFVCLSDVDVPCERIPLAEDWPGWWSKINLFHPESGLTGPTLYADLDTLVVGSLDAIAAYPHKFTMAHEFYKPKFMCSTAMAWTGDYSHIWRAFRADPEGIARRYDIERPQGRIGDQAFIEDQVKGAETFRDLFGEKSVASFKVHAKTRIPAGAAMVSFHGLPKMDTAGGWAQQMWDSMDGSEVQDGRIKRRGFWWPVSDDWCWRVIHDELPDLDAALKLVPGRAVAVQAGGNVGVWAAHMASHFESVYTFEPVAENYACLVQNVPPNVIHRQCGLGDKPGKIGVAIVPGNAGAHYVGGVGDIEVVTIDSLGLTACDFLCLDVEGSEPMALHGAVETIRKFRPVVMMEEKGLSEKYYKIPKGAAERWLIREHGYKVASRVRKDVILTP